MNRDIKAYVKPSFGPGRKYIKDQSTIDKVDNEFPGYPTYPSSDDIYREDKEFLGYT